MRRARPSSSGANPRGAARPGDRRAGPATASFPVVGVGASAGGLEAFRQLLAHVPASAGLALVLVQHLEPRRPSLLSDALGRATELKVAQAEDGARVEPNRVYVIPPGAQMTIENGVLRLSSRGDDAPRPHLPIDHFFRSLAAERGRQAIGVVLSGSASDGTEGLAAIRAHGGITFAQDPRSARCGEMPQSAIDAGVVDFSLALPALADELTRLARHPYLARREPVPPTPRGAASLARIFGLVRAACGVDFGEYKPATLKRRLARRMAVRRARDLAAYLDLLQEEPGEVRALHDDLLIQVTSFFRDPQGFAELEATALTDVLKHKAAGAPIRVWSVGCSTGEEVYSLAMSVVEVLGDSPSPHPVQVFGSDLSDQAIAHARAGLYSEAAMRDVGERRRGRFFTRSEHGWRVGKALRDLCVFARHDVGRDPPFSKIDVVSCRNVLIYFGHALRKRVLATLHHSLSQPGYLLLGRSEAVSSAPRLFARATDRLFARKAVASPFRLAPRAGALPLVHRPLAGETAAHPRSEGSLAQHVDATIPQERAAGPPKRPRTKAAGPRRRAVRPDAAAFRRLGEELASTKESLGSLVEEHGRANDELASANTELVSVNEVLQSTNEELETAKEELQATNEELTTVNDELDGRNQELQLANADLVNLLETVEIPIVILDAGRRIRRFTPRAGAFLHLTPAAVGKPIETVALQLRAPDLELWVAQAMQTDAMVESEVQDRADRWHRMQIRPHRALDGRADGTIVSLVDIHALKHDVADARRERDAARDVGNRAEELLDVVSLAAGELRLEDEWVDLAQVVLAALERVRAPAEARSLGIATDLAAAIPLFRGDPARLQQVVANLLANSVELTPEGGHVGVKLERVAGTARITVTDTGRGIDAGFLPRVFERFAQEDASRSRGHGGLGLGLSIARQIVELHGGTIRAESPGRDLGATFTATLPLRDALDALPAGRCAASRNAGDGGVHPPHG